MAEWRRRLSDWEATPEASGARAEKAQLEEERVALEARLGEEVGGFVRDIRSIESEIQRLESEAVAPHRPRPRPAPARDAGRLSRSARCWSRQPPSWGRARPGWAVPLRQGLAGDSAGLSFQRLSAVQVDDRGGMHAVMGGRPTPAMTLPAADRDLVYLAMKLALLEQALQGTKALAVVDDAFAGLSDGGRRFAARLLKQMARGAQLLHSTADAAFKEAADHTA